MNGLAVFLLIAAAAAIIVHTIAAIRAARSGAHSDILVLRTVSFVLAGWTTFGLIIICGAISYDHLHTLAGHNGQIGWRAAAFPLSVDGVEITSSLVLLTAHLQGRKAGWIPYLAFTASAMVSLAANVMTAPHTIIASCIAAWPAVALLVVSKLFFWLLDDTRTLHNTATSPTVDSPVESTSPTDITPAADQIAPQQPAPPPPAPRTPGYLPKDILRRIPVQVAEYQRWRTAWQGMQAGNTIEEVIENSGYSRRTVQHIRRAGEAHFLDDNTPPVELLSAILAQQDAPAAQPPASSAVSAVALMPLAAPVNGLAAFIGNNR